MKPADINYTVESQQDKHCSSQVHMRLPEYRPDTPGASACGWRVGILTSSPLPKILLS